MSDPPTTQPGVRNEAEAPPEGDEGPEEPGAGWLWLAAAVFLLAATAFGAWLLFGGDDNGQPAVPDFLVGAPEGAPHLDGLVTAANQEKITVRTHDGKPVTFAVTDEYRANVNVAHAQQHAAQGQPSRIYYEPGPGSELFAMYVADAAPPAANVPDDALAVTGTPVEMTDDGFVLETDDGKRLDFVVREQDARSVRIEHLEDHVEVPQPAIIRYVEENGTLFALSFADAPFTNEGPDAG